MDNDSNVCVGVLDLSKAFDKLNHYGLFLKLIERDVPACIINILHNWFSKTSTCVYWYGVRSSVISLNSGVRQVEI